MKLFKEVEKDQKTLTKENKRLQIFIIIFMVIALCLGTFYFNVICFGAGCESKSPKPLIIINSNNENTDAGEKTEEKNWTNYLLKQHILDAKITRNRSVDLGDSEDINKTVTISKDNLKEILSNLENKKIFKTWSGGRGGPTRDYLVITYEKNDQTYKFEIYYGDIAVDNLDAEFKDILENSKYEERETEYSNIDGAFYFYDIENFSEAIFDKYFN